MNFIGILLLLVLLSSCERNVSTNKTNESNKHIASQKIKLIFYDEKLDSATSLRLKKGYLNLYPIKQPVSNQSWHIRKLKITNNDTADYRILMNYYFFMFHNISIHLEECEQIRSTDDYYNICINAECWSNAYWEYPLRDSVQIIPAKSKVEVLAAFPLILYPCCQPEDTKIDTIILRHQFNKVRTDDTPYNEYYEVRLKIVMNGDEIISQEQIPSDAALPNQ